MPGDATSRELRETARLARREAALAARPSMSPPGPAPDRLRIASWNVNSLRARTAGLERFLRRTRPDVACLQETRVATFPDAAAAAAGELGYEVVHAGAGSFNGVAILARHPVSDVRTSGALGDEHLDREARVATCLVRAPEPIRVLSVYVPHGREVGHWHYDYKLAFLAALAERVAAWLALGDAVVLAGDVNVAATDSDVFHPDAFVGSTHVTERERHAWTHVLATGLVDVDAARWGPRARRFTWWNHGIGYSRNLGMRLDVIAVDATTAARLDTTWIDHVERGAERPSDHAPCSPTSTATSNLPARSTRSVPAMSSSGQPRFVDLSHEIDDGMVTYPGLPVPVVGTHLSREAAEEVYGPGVTFHIGTVTLCTNTGTYLDVPFHRFADGHDLAGLTLDRVAAVPAVCLDRRGERAIAVDAAQAEGLRGRAVLVRTDHSRHFGTPAYATDHPFLTASTAEALAAAGVACVGIDSLNIDDTADMQRPVHTALLRAGIPIVEHLTNLAELPPDGFTFTAVPPKIVGAGTFTVRAFASLR